MSGHPAGCGSDSVTYTYRPSLMGAPWEFRLTDDGIEWAAGANPAALPSAMSAVVRMSFRPANMQSHRFMTEIWADGAPKLRDRVQLVEKHVRAGAAR